MVKSGLRIGLLGGTFDPPHLAHLRIAEEARIAFSLSEIWFIPAGYPPHKEIPPSPFEVRLEMLKLATQNNPFFQILEIEREEKPSYTLKTLEKLKKLYPFYYFYLLLGWDAYLELETWWHYERFLDYVELIVLSRGRGDWSKANEEVKKKALKFWGRDAIDKVHFLQVFPLEISSTQIRDLIKRKESIRYLVPEEVYFYLQKNPLYKD